MKIYFENNHSISIYFMCPFINVDIETILSRHLINIYLRLVIIYEWVNDYFITILSFNNKINNIPMSIMTIFKHTFIVK